MMHPAHPLRLHLFANTAALFAVAQILGVVVADQLHALVFPTVMEAQPPDSRALFFFLAAFFIISFLLLVLVRAHKGTVVYRTLFSLVALVGLLKLFELVFPLPLALAVSAIFLLGFYFVPTVWAHDIVVIAASAGIGPVFGLQFAIPTALALLAILSAYDLVAVLVTKHMQHLEHHLIASQASFALMIPEHAGDFSAPLTAVRPGSGFLILGGGDLILPMFLTTGLYLQRPVLAYCAIAGMLLGLFASHVWLMERRSALPALPFITLGAVLGMAAGFFLG